MIFKFVLLFGLFAGFIGPGETSNILCLFTSVSKSHLIVHMSYARALIERGHNVTIVTTLPLKEKSTSFHHIYIPPAEGRIKEMDDVKSEMSKSQSAFESMKLAIRGIKAFGPTQYETIKDHRFQEFMHNPDNKFDLLLLGYFINDYQLGLGLHFKCPIVMSWMSAPNLIVDRYLGNPPEISYVPASHMISPPNPLTFKGRLVNFLLSFTTKGLAFIIGKQIDGYYKDLFPDYPDLREAGKKVSLLLCNSHFSEGIVRPNVPAIIEVGGIQVKNKPDPLPDDLQEIFDSSSEHGVIYLSFGSNLGSSDMRPETYQVIYKALAGLKQKVLWKWDGAEKLGDAKNIHYQSWLPQDDILAQPNLKLFITHAGKGSVAESQYHGVPMVAIPVFADQPSNAEQLAKDGFGLKLQHNTMTVETLRAAIMEVLENPKYLENVKRFSTLYRDRPMSARETAIYWIEYVIRHNGAYHMQSPLVHLNYLQYISADVVAFLLLVLYVMYRLVKIPTKYLVRKLCNKYCSKKQKVKRQ